MHTNERYIRQMILPGFGLAAQQKLGAARLLIVGMGGLGCPALQYLVGAGVGHIGIVDPDNISMSNLHRQLLFNELEIGQKKVQVAAAKMKQLNQHVTIAAYPFLLSSSNAASIITNYDLVIDATDNFLAKYLINDICVQLKKPFVYGAVSRYEGQLSVFNFSAVPTTARLLNYRDLFSVAPLPGEIKSCEETGVIGVLPGIIGAMQAAEAVKIITGIGNPLYGSLFNYNLLEGRSYEIAICFREKNSTINDSITPEGHDIFEEEEVDIKEINVAEFNAMLQQKQVFVLDVREMHEYPSIDFSDGQIPMSELQASMQLLPEKEICVICHQGIRSIYAAQLIKAQRNLTVYSLKGGLTAYFKTNLV